MMRGIFKILGIFLSLTLVTSHPKLESAEGQVDEKHGKFIDVQLNKTGLAWTPSLDLLRRFPYYLSGFDEDSRPIWIIEFGKWDVRGEVDKGGDQVQNMSRYIDQLFWRIQDSIEIANTQEEPVQDGILVIDMDGFNLYQASAPNTQFLFRKARQIQPTAPLMERGFFLNVNFVAQALINILSPVIGSFISKSDIYGTSRAKWIPEFLKKLPKESLPITYGGLVEQPVAF